MDPEVPRFLCRPCIIRVPFFLLFGFNKGTLKPKNGKRVLLGNLAYMGDLSDKGREQVSKSRP